MRYDLSVSVDELRETYEYNETCQRTVPEAIRCFLEADGFEDAIRDEALGSLDAGLLDTYLKFVLQVGN